jgi:hypothetical protein
VLDVGGDVEAALDGGVDLDGAVSGDHGSEAYAARSAPRASFSTICG